jgi:hypothetical protein
VANELGSGTDRGAEFAGVMQSTEAMTLEELKKLPQGSWPTYLSPVDFQRYAVAERQVEVAIQFLYVERQTVLEKIHSARRRLIERQNAFESKNS